MRIKELHLTNDAFIMMRGENTKRITSSDKVSIELDLPTASMRIEDRHPGGLGIYHIPLACIRCWIPVPAEPLGQQQKKAANQ